MSTELNMNETVNTSVVDAVVNEKPVQPESYEQFLSRRTQAMAGMIGYACSSLGSIGISASSTLQHYDTVELLKKAIQEIAISSISAQMVLEAEWMEMNSHHDPEYIGNKHSREKIHRLAEELKALKTLTF